MPLEEIVYSREPFPEPSDKKCPNCGQYTYFVSIACPEGRSGCLVLHYGYRCFDCGKNYRYVKEIGDGEKT